MGPELLPARAASPRGAFPARENRVQALQSPGIGQEADAPQFSRYIAALKRYKWLLLIILAIGGVASVAATRFVRPEYEVHATIWLASETPQGRTVGPFRAGELVNSTAWPDLLTSYAILDSVVLKVRLYVHAANATDAPLFTNFQLANVFRPGQYRLDITGATHQYVLATDRGAVVEHGTVGDSVGRQVGFEWIPAVSPNANRTIKFSVVPPRAASVELRKNLEATLPPNANLLQIGLQGPQAELVTNTANTLLHQFVGTAATLKSRNLVELASTLEKQLTYAQTQLRDAEIALESFRVNTITLPSEGGPVATGVEVTRAPALTSFFNEKIDLDNVVHDRQLLEQMLAELKAGTLDVSSLWFVSAVQTGPPELRNALTEYATKSAALRAAREVFTDEHRSVKDLDASLRDLREKTIPQLGVELVNQLREREQALNSRISNAGKELKQIPTRTIEEMRLTRNVAVRENLYTTLKNRYEEARLASASAIPDVSILDSAVVPQFPNNNSKSRILALGVLGSLGAAILLALLLDRLDPRFHYPSQVSHDLQLDILGVVPAIEPGNKSPQNASNIIESFRSLRLALTHAFAETGVPMLTVSSPGPEDGKSIVCANLALSFAGGGYRTILVDGDIRRGDLHGTLGVSRVPGLTDVLMDVATTTEIIRPTSTERLWIMPSGSRLSTGPELLTSQRLVQLIAELQSSFDVVIVDSAPLGAGIDAFALANATRNMIMVMRSGKTDRRLAEAKLRILDRLPVNILGAVLNGIRTEGEYQYYRYLSEYTIEPEDARESATGVV
jgi:succinoglycan biosynthesis transport protein ExoP